MQKKLVEKSLWVSYPLQFVSEAAFKDPDFEQIVARTAEVCAHKQVDHK